MAKNLTTPQSFLLSRLANSERWHEQWSPPYREVAYASLRASTLQYLLRTYAKGIGHHDFLGRKWHGKQVTPLWKTTEFSNAKSRSRLRLLVLENIHTVSSPRTTQLRRTCLIFLQPSYDWSLSMKHHHRVPASSSYVPRKHFGATLFGSTRMSLTMAVRDCRTINSHSTFMMISPQTTVQGALQSKTECYVQAF